MIRSYMIFSGVGPILVITRLNSGMQSPEAKRHFANKGIMKYIAFEVATSRVEELYTIRYHTALLRIASESDIRVVDMNGHNVFSNFDFAEMGEPVYVGGELDEENEDNWSQWKE